MSQLNLLIKFVLLFRVEKLSKTIYMAMESSIKTYSSARTIPVSAYSLRNLVSLSANVGRDIGFLKFCMSRKGCQEICPTGKSFIGKLQIFWNVAFLNRSLIHPTLSNKKYYAKSPQIKLRFSSMYLKHTCIMYSGYIKTKSNYVMHLS